MSVSWQERKPQCKKGRLVKGPYKIIYPYVYICIYIYTSCLSNQSVGTAMYVPITVFFVQSPFLVLVSNTPKFNMGGKNDGLVSFKPISNN